MIQIDPWVYFFAALVILILPLDWLLAAFFAAVFHELCHMAAIRLLGGSVRHICIGIGGAEIITEVTGLDKELLSTIAGPVGSLILLCLLRVFPKLAICGCIQGIFNLIPVYPLDGGRILRCSLVYLCPQKAALVEKVVIFSFIVLTVIGSVVFSTGSISAWIAAFLILKAIIRKRPCKRSQIGVQ